MKETHYKVLTLGYDRHEAVMWREGDTLFPPLELEARLNALAAYGWRIVERVTAGHLSQLILEQEA